MTNVIAAVMPCFRITVRSELLSQFSQGMFAIEWFEMMDGLVFS